VYSLVFEWGLDGGDIFVSELINMCRMLTFCRASLGIDILGDGCCVYAWFGGGVEEGYAGGG
jgi:hypothetical protein